MIYTPKNGVGSEVYVVPLGGIAFQSGGEVRYTIHFNSGDLEITEAEFFEFQARRKRVWDYDPVDCACGAYTLGEQGIVPRRSCWNGKPSSDGDHTRYRCDADGGGEYVLGH